MHMYVTYVFEKLQAVIYVTHDTNKASHGGKCNFSDLFYEVKKFNIYHLYATDINVVSDIKAAASFSRPWSQFFPIQTPQPANKIYLCTVYLASIENFSYKCKT